MVIAKPFALLIQRHQKDLMRLQVTENRSAVMGIAQGIAQLGAKALLAGCFIEKGLHVRRLALNHLLQQVVVNQPIAALHMRR